MVYLGSLFKIKLWIKMSFHREKKTFPHQKNTINIHEIFYKNNSAMFIKL